MPGRRSGDVLVSAAALGLALAVALAGAACRPSGQRRDLLGAAARGAFLDHDARTALRKGGEAAYPTLDKLGLLAADRGDSQVATLPRDPGGAVIVPSSGTLVVPVRMPARPEALEVAVRGSGEPEVGVTFLSPEGEETWLGRREQGPGPPLPLPAELAGRTGLLLLRVKAGDRAPVHIAVLALTGEWESAPNPDAVPAGERPPTVIVIVLDAARSRNFGVYGYHRATSPHVDRLAEESLVFTRAFAECPTTVCSIPNILSGVPFIPVVPDQSYRIDDRVETLAEILGPLGYRTVAFVANANASQAHNADQGFDEFHELWKYPDRPPWDLPADPHWLTHLAVAAVRGLSPRQPLFLYLHYLPPHEPYEPAQDFDVFGDPGYAGPVVPGMSLREVHQGTLRLSEADRAELLAHYDGNLRMVDDALGRLFAALREVGRWDDALVALTSDHGEAFYEHGVRGHNSTLYDEMLHVPFLLRLPGGQRPAGVDVDRLVLLADLVPTLLGRLGRTPGPAVGGIDLLADSGPPDRVAFLRKAGHSREFGIRSRSWKAIVDLGQPDPPPRLFDLVADPEERVDRSGERPELLVGYLLLLREHAAMARALGLEAGEEVTLSPEDLEALRALGYL